MAYYSVRLINGPEPVFFALNVFENKHGISSGIGEIGTVDQSVFISFSKCLEFKVSIHRKYTPLGILSFSVR